jgi:primosomal protein N' (replication factor Y) (superfamily II helicase)
MSKFARVIVDLSLDRIFDYGIPDELQGQIHVGSRVNVPFNRGIRRGYVLALSNESDCPPEKLKQVEDLCDNHVRIPHSLVELGEWIADYYCCTREQAIRALLPGAVRSGKIKHKTLKIYSIADSEKAEQHVIDHEGKKRYAAQLAILKLLLTHREVFRDKLLRDTKCSDSPLKTLIKAGIITEEKRKVRRDPYENVTFIPDFPKEPNAEQAASLEKIYAMLDDKDRKKHVMLLHGITGSGKTEVYLQAIAKALETGRESIVLVPEISLTPQTVRRFRARFGDRVSVLHSRLTEGERFDEWTKVSEGLVKIVIGARSALFAPFRKLGLIIVDEEHESSYKQSSSPRYHARDVAVVRGAKEGAVVILGTATPSFESYNNALQGKYIYAELKERAEACYLPQIDLIDMRMDSDEEGKVGLFSKTLIKAVRDRIFRGEQVILFLNRLGYARQMMCDQCGYVANCPNCSVSYTFHRKRNTLSCHLCGSVIRAPIVCPDCQSEEIRYTGSGTEKIESIAASLFKPARVVRMDSDTMRSAAAYEDALDGFRRGETDILIGTQMIAKGLHFPNVTLVGVLNADQGLYMPDFRAGERTFQLLTQVAGRAGRGDVSGQVIIQTFNPHNETIEYAAAHNFKGFYDFDMMVREMLTYPPDGHLITVYFLGPVEREVRECCDSFMTHLQPYCHKKVIVSEPAPAPIERIEGKYRYLIIFRGHRLKQLREAIRNLVWHAPRPKNVDVYADVDALSQM